MKKRKKFSKEIDLLMDNSPIVDYETYGRDADILHKKLQNKNINNIAIIGQYGSGKSSLISTYLDKYREGSYWIRFKNFFLKKPSYTRISLASFNKKEYADCEIEGSILQQLFYSQKKSKLPNSAVERTNKTNWFSSFFTSLLIVLFLASIALFGIRQTDNGFLSQDNLYFLNYIFLGIACFTGLSLSFFAIYFRKLKKINYKSIEVSFERNENDKVINAKGQSLLNKFVDEVLYFFECVNIDLVIFEDLDRHDNSSIFVKLRELNTIINNSKKKAKKIVFLYAIKDDVFESEEDRSKFFEFLLPIIPVINPVTTAIKVREINKKIEGKFKEMAITEDFIKGISVYIPNMRVLKNSFNDYIIMHERVFCEAEKGRLKNDNLFALSLFKNLFPQDYSQLEKNAGIIPLIIDADFLRKDNIDMLREEKTQLQKQIENGEKEHLQSFDELKALLINQAIDYGPNYNIQGSVDIRNLKTFKDLDFKKLIFPINSYNYSINFKLNPTYASPNGESYYEREQRITSKINDGRDYLQKKIEDLDNKLNNLQSMNFTRLINEFGLEQCVKNIIDKKLNIKQVAIAYGISFDEKGPTLDKLYEKQIGYIKFLIKNGYISDNFIEYTSSYKTSLINSSDVAFIKNVQSGKQVFNAKISNIKVVVDILNDDDFIDEAILNYDLLNNLTYIKTKSTKFHNLIFLLKKQGKNIQQAIVSFIDKADDYEITNFLGIVFPQDKQFCNRFFTSASTDMSKKILDILLKSDLTIIADQNTNGIVSKTLASILNGITLLSLTNQPEEHLKKILDETQPKFENISITDNKLDKILFSYAVKKCYYQINLTNLRVIFSDKGISEDDLINKNFYSILSSNDEVLKKYIKDNIDTYVARVLLNTEVIGENELQENIIELLKNTFIKQEYRENLISKYTICISSLNEFAKELYPLFLSTNKVAASWKNIEEAIKSNVDEQLVIDFLLKNASNLSGNFSFDISKDNQNHLFTKIINIQNQEDISSMLKQLGIRIDSVFSLEKTMTNDYNLKVFISCKKILYNKNDFQLLQPMQESLIEYIKVYNREIIDDFDTFFSNALEPKTISTLLDNKEISNNIKQKLLSKFANNILISGHEKIIYDLVMTSGLQINEILLLKFKDTTILSNCEKIDLAQKVELDFNPSNDPLKEFIESIIPELKESKARIKDITAGQSKIASIYAKMTGKKYIKRNKTGIVE